MDTWSEDFLTGLQNSHNEESVFACVLSTAQNLGFDYCAYGLRLPLPIINPQVFMLNNYPLAWRQEYEEAGYLAVDPIVSHGRRTQTALVWDDSVFSSVQEMWEDARSFGLRVGWSQSNFDCNGTVGMLSLSRSESSLTEKELQANEAKMRYLVSASHSALSRLLSSKSDIYTKVSLTAREIEILKWISDGKTSKETSNILHISVDTVNFHMKNAILKLKSTNKTGAVVRALMLGLLG